MMELTVIRVSLDFACGICNRDFGVTVDCSGKGLSSRSRTVLAFHVPCPHCNGINRVSFEPCGVVRDVVPVKGRSPRYEPSLN
jgi:hypothetical protein